MKKIIALLLVLVLTFSFAACSNGNKTQSENTVTAAVDANAAQIEEAVAEYTKVFNTMRQDTTFVGSVACEFNNMTLNEKSNPLVDSVASGIAKGLNTSGVPLPPYETVEGKEGEYLYDKAQTCLVKPEDIKTAELTDNGDGTATIKLYTLDEENPAQFNSANGHMFFIIALDFPNIVYNFANSYCEITYDKTNYKMISGVYHENLSFKADNLDVPEFPILKGKSLAGDIVFTLTYPAK